MYLVTAGRTGPNRSVRFGDDRSLDDRGRRDVRKLGPTLAHPVAACGPETAVRETARLLGADDTALVDDAVRTLDVGLWTGRTPEEVDVDELAAWFTDPRARPHGGECVDDFVTRVRHWCASASTRLGDRTVVVAMPVAQALLCVDAGSYFRTEVRPAAVYDVWAEKSSGPRRAAGRAGPERNKTVPTYLDIGSDS